MNFNLTKIIFVILCSVLISCSEGIQEGSKLTVKESAYWKEIGLLDVDEKVLFFNSQSNFHTSGNFITNKRLASYWIQEEKDIQNINSALYPEIDSIYTKDLSSSLTYASYLHIFKHDGTEFKVYIDDGTEKTEVFFEKVKQEWEKSK